MKNQNVTWVGAGVAVAMVVSALVVRDGLVRFRSFGRSVEVRGLAERLVKSNEGKLQLNFVATGASLQDVHSRVARSQEAIDRFLTRQGFESGEIQRETVSITDNKANSYGSNKEVERYVARGAVVLNSAKVDAVTKASQSTSELLKDGVTLESANLSYFFTALNEIKPAMLEEATANARQAAQSFASNSSSDLGDIKSASQGLFSISSPNSEYDSGSSITKKVRVVTQVQYYLE